jgi:hypothetical protein
MSRETTPTSPEKIAEPAEVIPQPLTIKAIEGLRRQEAEEEAKVPFGDDEKHDEALAKARESFDTFVGEHLLKFGIIPGDENYDEYAKILREASVDHITAYQWEEGNLLDDDSERVPRREALEDALKEKFGVSSERDDDTSKDTDTDKDKDDAKEADDKEDDSSKVVPADTDAPAPDTDTPPVDTPDDTGDTLVLPVVKSPEEIKAVVDADPTVRGARAKVGVLRDELAELSARRQRRLFTSSSAKREYTDKEDQYKVAVNELAKAELEAEKNAGHERNETEERFAAAFKLVDHYRKLQQASVDKLKDTKVSGFIRFMTSGSTAMRMLKGAGLGVGVGLLSASLLAVTGGAAVAGLAAAGVAAGRFARSYARFDNEDDRGLEVADSSLDTEVVSEAGAADKNTDETIDLVNKYLMKQLELDTKAEQGKRRSATTKAMAMVAVGSLAGEALHYGHDLYASHHAHGLDSSSGDKSGNGSGPNTDPGAGGRPEVKDLYHFDPDGQALHEGDGFYSVFKEMNDNGQVEIPQKDWSALLEQAGPKLHDVQVDGHPLAYRMPDGQWGVRMTSNGMFPKEGLDIIASTHDHMNGITTGSSVADQASEVTPRNPVVETDTSSVDTSAADADMTTEVPIAHNMIDNILDKPVVNPSDITGNPSLSQLTHVIPDSHASYLANKLNLRPSEWQPIEGYIAQQTAQGRPLYGNVFNITTNGVVEFKTNTIPPATMADIITRIPTSVRSRL